MTAPTAPVDIGTLIESIPNVCGGSPVLKGTRMPVKALASHHRSGMDAAELARQFDLAPELVYAGLAFYFANQPAVDAELEFLDLSFCQEALDCRCNLDRDDRKYFLMLFCDANLLIVGLDRDHA